jgi:hypothetical protein
VRNNVDRVKPVDSLEHLRHLPRSGLARIKNNGLHVGPQIPQ